MDKDIKEEINEVMDDMNSDEEVIICYDKEQHEIALRNTLCSEAIQEGYSEGYDIGYDSGYDSGYGNGYGEGLEKGIKQQEINIAKNMLKNNISVDLIKKCTNLSIEEIKEFE